MMTKRAFIIFIAILILFSISGCQLAIEDKGEAKSRDRLIGILITEDYLDLFDMEKYLNDNINKITDGGLISIDGDNSQYQKRLYATLKTRTLKDETGKTFDTKEFIFEGIDGISYFAAEVPATETEDSYTTSGSDEAVSDGHMGMHYGDNEEKITLDGTIYISSTHNSKIRHINPVYQSPDGSVYTISGNGLMFSGDQGEGSIYSTTLDETITVTENGKSKTVSASIKISIAIMYPPEKISVLQMDKDSKVISRLEYAPGKLPDTITPTDKAEYIIVESHKNNNEGQVVTSRTIYDREVESLDTFYCRNDGICVKQWTKLDWNKN